MLSQATGYGIRALVRLGREYPDALFIREISEEEGIPYPFLAKIIHLLAQEGLVVTQKGIGGGVRLSAQPSSITLYAIVQALHDPILKNQCFLGRPDCDGLCPVHSFWMKKREEILQYLKTSTLAVLAGALPRKSTQKPKNRKMKV
ncbi:MAG: RrF2 family transcriptional regulator [bacterium JZ-2024 1]